VKVSTLTVPSIRAFEGDMRANGRSPAMTRKVLASLGGIIADAQERGLAMHNPVREMRANRGKRRTKATRERKKPLAVGVDIPTPAEIMAVQRAASGFRRAFFATAAFAGLRASELRGLRWQDVDLAKGTITVCQRADAWGDIDQPKSEAGHRTVPMMKELVVNPLKEWKLACPLRSTGKKDANGEPIKGLHYVFPTGKGKVESHSNLVQRHWWPLQIAAGVSVPVLDEAGNPVMALDDDGKPLLGEDGKPIPVMAAKYRGLHALRHFFCSWCAARPQDGGLGLPLKTVQVRMGHSTLAMTADTYGHLFPSQDDAEVLAAGERALMGV
jgi:integrase